MLVFYYTYANKYTNIQWKIFNSLQLLFNEMTQREKWQRCHYFDFTHTHTKATNKGSLPI